MKNKNNLFLTAMLALTLAFGMTVIGCGDGTTPTNGDDNTDTTANQRKIYPSHFAGIWQSSSWWFSISTNTMQTGYVGGIGTVYTIVWSEPMPNPLTSGPNSREFYPNGYKITLNNGTCYYLYLHLDGNSLVSGYQYPEPESDIYKYK